MKVLDSIVFYNDPEAVVTGNVVARLKRFAKMEPLEIHRYIKAKIKNTDKYEIDVMNTALNMIVSGDAKFVWKEVVPEVVVEEPDEAEIDFLKKIATVDKTKVATAPPLPSMTEDIPDEFPDGEFSDVEQESKAELAKMEQEVATKVYVPNTLVEMVKEKIKGKAGRPKKK